MRSVSLGYREAIKKGFAPYFKATAVFPNGYFSDSSHRSVTLPLVGKLPQSEYDQSYVDKWGYTSDFMENTVEYQAGTSSSGKFDVGGCVISELSFTLNNNNRKFDDLDFSGAYIIPSIGVRTIEFKNYLYTEAAVSDEDFAHVIATEDNEPMAAEFESASNIGNTEWVRMGTFYFVSHKQTGNTIICETYDQLKFLDQYHIIADDNISFPITAHDLVHQICTSRGIVLYNENFNGYGTVLQTAPTNDLTERQALSYVAQLCGCYARMIVVGSTDRLALSWYDLNNSFTSKQRFSHTLETIDVTITGVRVHDVNNAKTSYLYPENSEKSGSYYYTLDITGNPWIVDTSEDKKTTSNLQAIARQIASRVVGMTFTPGTETIFTDPSIEAGDVLRVYADNIKTYKNFIITNLDMKLGVTETITCDAEPVDSNDLRQTMAQTKVDQAQQYVGQRLTAYQTMSNLFTRLAKESLGTYKIEERQDDGTIITYYATVPLLSNATRQSPAIVWRLSAEAIQVCDRYVYGADDNQWTGYTADGNALAKTLTAIGINAQWISGDLKDGKANYWNLNDGSFYLGGKYGDKETFVQRKPDGTLEIVASSVRSDWVYTGGISGNQVSGQLTDNYNNYWNLGTGTFFLGNSSSYIKKDGDALSIIVGGKTVNDIAEETASSVAEDKAKAAVDAQTQTDIFNKLTNDGAVKGIILTGNQLYINADYINSGVIKGIEIQATKGTIGGYTIENNYLHHNDGNHSVGMSSTNNIMWAFWAGAEEPSNAPFRVGHDGELYATNGHFTGELNATSGSFNSGIVTIDGDKVRCNGSWNSEMNSTGVVAQQIYACRNTDNPTGSAVVWLGIDNPTGNVGFFYGGIDVVNSNVQCRSLNNVLVSDITGESDKRIKQDIAPLDTEQSLKFIQSLKPVSYAFKSDGVKRHGFVAQDIKRSLNKLGDSWGVWQKTENEENGIKHIQRVDYKEIIADLVSVVQQQEKRIVQLERNVANNTH